MANLHFTSRQLTENTFIISGKGADSYLLLGEEEAIMIDAGQSEFNIRAYAQTLTDLPLSKVINTHSHFDHTGGNGFFDTIYGTEGISRSAKNCSRNAELYPLDYSFTFIKDHDIIPIKGRPLQIILLDCHSPENIAILDETNRMLFPGDELESGQVLLLPGFAEEIGKPCAGHAASVETYLHAMEKLKSFESKFDTICPAHNGTPIYKGYLDQYITLAQMILDGYEGSTDCSSPTYPSSMGHFPLPEANYRRGEYKGASLIYCSDLIWDKDYEHADSLPVPTKAHLLSSQSARR